METLYTFLPHKWQGPSKDIHEVRKPIWMLNRNELSAVSHCCHISTQQLQAINQSYYHIVITIRDHSYTTKPVVGRGWSRCVAS